MSTPIDLIKGAKAAAAYLGIPTGTVFRLAEEGRIPVIRMGRSLYFRRSELDQAFSSLEAA